MEEEKKISLEKFLEMLKGHDWYYTYSDDHRVYMRGAKREAELIEIAVRNDFIKEFEAARPKRENEDGR